MSDERLDAIRERVYDRLNDPASVLSRGDRKWLLAEVERLREVLRQVFDELWDPDGNYPELENAREIARAALAAEEER